MERLTHRRDSDGAACPNIKESEVLTKWGDWVQNSTEKLCAYEDAEEAGLLARIDEQFALAMLAGAKAIEQNQRKYFGTTFVYDVFGVNPQKITYYDAAKALRKEAEAALAKEG